MQLDLIDEQRRALFNLLIETIEATPTPSPRALGCCARSWRSSARWGATASRAWPSRFQS
jgi:hypothetical protein